MGLLCPESTLSLPPGPLQGESAASVLQNRIYFIFLSMPETGISVSHACLLLSCAKLHWLQIWPEEINPATAKNRGPPARRYNPSTVLSFICWIKRQVWGRCEHPPSTEWVRKPSLISGLCALVLKARLSIHIHGDYLKSQSVTFLSCRNINAVGALN